MRSHGKAWATLVVIVVVSFTADVGATWPQDDAGSGRDAGNTIQQSLKLSAAGSYAAALAPDDSADWYRMKVPARSDASCVSATATDAPSHRTRLVAVDADGSNEATARSVAGRATRVGVANDGLSGAILGITADAAPTALDAYGFQLREWTAVTMGPQDAGTGQDAGMTIAGAIPVPASCFAGRLDPGGGDSVDTYTFEGQAGDRVFVTLGDATNQASLALFGVGGTLLGSTGDALSITLPTSGTYTMQTSTSSTQGTIPYVLGLCDPDCGPPQNPCDPMCIALLEEE